MTSIMNTDKFQVNDLLRIESNGSALQLKAREEVGRGKQFGTAGEIELSESDAETLAKWILGRQVITEAE